MYGKDPSMMNQTGLMREMVIEKINKELNIEEDSYFDEERSDLGLAGALRLEHRVNIWENSHGRDKSNDLISQKKRRIQSTGIPHNRNQARRRTPDVDKGNYKASSPLIEKDNYMIERDLNLQMARMKLAEIAEKNQQPESIHSPLSTLGGKFIPLDTQITDGDDLNVYCIGSNHSPEQACRNKAPSDIRYANKIGSTKKNFRATFDDNLGQPPYTSDFSSRIYNKNKTTDLDIGGNRITNNGENMTRFHSEKIDVNGLRAQKTQPIGTPRLCRFGIDDIGSPESSCRKVGKAPTLYMSKDTGDQKTKQNSLEHRNERTPTSKNSYARKVTVVNNYKVSHGKTLTKDEILDSINISIREESSDDDELS